MAKKTFKKPDFSKLSNEELMAAAPSDITSKEWALAIRDLFQEGTVAEEVP